MSMLSVWPREPLDGPERLTLRSVDVAVSDMAMAPVARTCECGGARMASVAGAVRWNREWRMVNCECSDTSLHESGRSVHLRFTDQRFPFRFPVSHADAFARRFAIDPLEQALEHRAGADFIELVEASVEQMPHRRFPADRLDDLANE